MNSLKSFLGQIRHFLISSWRFVNHGLWHGMFCESILTHSLEQSTTLGRATFCTPEDLLSIPFPKNNICFFNQCTWFSKQEEYCILFNDIISSGHSYRKPSLLKISQDNPKYNWNYITLGFTLILSVPILVPVHYILICFGTKER